MADARIGLRGWLIVALLGVTVIVLWLSLPLRKEQPEQRTAAALQPGAATPLESAALLERGGGASATAPSVAEPARSQARSARARQLTPEVERRRARVLESLDQRQRERAAGAGSGASAARATAPTPPTPGDMKDRTGELDEETLYVLNHELMPMVGECLDQARERDPKLAGMFAVDIELAAAGEVGAIIEAVDAAPGENEVADDELIECVRQSAFTIELPMPVKDGRMSRQLTMPLGDTENE